MVLFPNFLEKMLSNTRYTSRIPLFIHSKSLVKILPFIPKIVDQNVAPGDDNLVVYSHPLGEGPSTGTARLIDKDDPRSRLHFVKYLKRDGKTLKIWECGICKPLVLILTDKFFATIGNG